MLGLAVSDIGFGRSFILELGRRFDSVSGCARGWCPSQSRRFPSEVPGCTLNRSILTLAEVVVANPSFRVDEILRWPVFVVERTPNCVVAVDGNRIDNRCKSRACNGLSCE